MVRFTVLVLTLVFAGTAKADDDIFRQECKLSGLKNGALEVSSEAKLFDGKRLLGSVKHPGLEAFNQAKADVTCAGSKIELNWQMPFSAEFYGYELAWKDQKLVLVSYRHGDPSLDQLVAARKALVAGKVEDALSAIESIDEYPGHYLSTEFLATVVESAWKESTARYKQKHAANAADLLGRALTLFDDNGGAGEQAPLLTPQRNDYGFFLAEAGKPAEAEPVLRDVVKAAPERTAAHLNLADVLWALDKKEEARTEYAAYASLADKKWPARVAERCPGCKPK